MYLISEASTSFEAFFVRVECPARSAGAFAKDWLKAFATVCLVLTRLLMHVRLIDANSVGYAHHHAADQRFVGDMQTHAVHGLLWHIRRNLQIDPDMLNVLVWDGRAHWRYAMHPGYKAGRHRTAEQRETRRQYEAQRPLIQRALQNFPVLQVRVPDSEADDLAWGLSRQLSAQGHRVTVFTADSDWLSMVNARTAWVNARKPQQIIELDGFSKATGFPSPGQVAAIKALSGDDADDIEGVHDIGPKRAAALIQRHGSLAGVFRAAQDIFTFSQEPKYFHALMLAEVQERVLRNERLVDLSKGPALHSSSVELQVGEYDPLELYELFVDLEFKQWQESFPQWEKVLSMEPPTANFLSVKRALANLAQSWA